jgi:hypothetical protein
MICAKCGSNWPSGSGEEVENSKSLHTDGRTTGDQKNFSSGEVKISNQYIAHVWLPTC